MLDPERGQVGLRGRLTASIVAILFLALAATFAAVYRGTGSDLRSGIDSDLTRDAQSLSQHLSNPPPVGPAMLKRRADRLLRTQPFGPAARVVSVTIPGAGVATNQPELLGFGHEGEKAAETQREERDSVHLLTSQPGFRTVPVEDTGDVRLLTQPVSVSGRAVATLRIGEPLEPVDRALDGLGRTFLIVGAIALLLGAVASYLLAARTARPLRRMAKVAEDVDAGELSHRMELPPAHDEVRRLAESFNHMLGRLEDAFSRERSFVADASHELRTPLTVIRGQLEVLAREEHPSPEDVGRVADQVNSAVARMQRLVDDLLLLARADTGFVLRTESTPLRPYLEAQLDGFRAAADRDFTLGPVPPVSVEIDPEKVGQVVWNLLSNAVDHTRAGGMVSLSARARPGWISIAVDDDGPGIPVSERELIFDRFHRTDSSRSRRAGGSGLGLAIARALVEAHGGRIQAGSSPRGGAHIEFDLPRRGKG